MSAHKYFISAIIIFFFMLLPPFQHRGICEDRISFAVIFLGGPDTGAEGEKIISQFMDSLIKLSGLKKDSLQGKYFNTVDSAKTYIQQNKNSYIMGSIAFYLANRKSMNLDPLAVVKIQGGSREQYYLIANKERYKSLAELKGKVLSGNILYEDKKFINRLIFNNTIDVSEYFKLKPSNRPLSAVKKLIRGEYDAVLLNHLQYNNLKSLAEFSKIQIIHKSPQMPALGLMMISTEKNKSVKNKIVNSVTTMCNQKDTNEACKNFGIDGFEPIRAEALDNEIKKYENNQ
jgi:ABC-type phosphate/phosphonate transport system substrate-binding protein